MRLLEALRVSREVESMTGNSNILVEITDAQEFHCFRLVLNPKAGALPLETEELSRLLTAAENVALHSWTPSVTEQYHHERIRDMEKLREIVKAVRNTHEQGQIDSVGQIEIMLHARSLVDLIHKCSEALCDWQQQTTGYLIDLVKGTK